MSTFLETPLCDKIQQLIDFVNDLPSTEDTIITSESKSKPSSIDVITTNNSNQDETKWDTTVETQLTNNIDMDDKKIDNNLEEIIDTINGCDIPFYRSKHLNFILKLQNVEESYEYCQTEHLRMQVLYWALCALMLLNELSSINSIKQKEMIKFVLDCYDNESGGFGGNIGHDPHLLNTLSAIQILLILNCKQSFQSQNNTSKNIYKILSKSQINQIIKYILSLQKDDGSFTGDKWGEVDTRFTYAACNALSLLGGLSLMNTKTCIEHLIKCRNFDGGFGTIPFAESHSGMIFCCVGSLAILNNLCQVDIDVLNWWLCERQVKSLKIEYDGGLNGRPEKLSDVCYSWWVLSGMSICNKIHWINQNRLVKFILTCQDKDDGGISDRPSDLADIYHTYFGIAGLSLLNKGNFELINPIWALPEKLLLDIGILSNDQNDQTKNVINHDWILNGHNQYN